MPKGKRTGSRGSSTPSAASSRRGRSSRTRGGTSGQPGSLPSTSSGPTSFPSDFAGFLAVIREEVRQELSRQPGSDGSSVSHTANQWRHLSPPPALDRLMCTPLLLHCHWARCHPLDHLPQFWGQAHWLVWGLRLVVDRPPQSLRQWLGIYYFQVRQCRLGLVYQLRQPLIRIQGCPSPCRRLLSWGSS